MSPIADAALLATILTMAGIGLEMDKGKMITVGKDHKEKIVNPRAKIASSSRFSDYAEKMIHGRWLIGTSSLTLC